MLSLLSFLAAAGLIVLLPGPDTLIVLRSLMRGGRPQGVRALAGICTAQAIWISATVGGLTALLRASSDGYLALRLAGAAYLITLGVQALRSRSAGFDPASQEGSSGLLGSGFRAGLLTDLLNPKVGVFFVTFLPAFVPSGAPTTPWLLLLGGIFVVETIAYCSVLVWSGDRVLGLLRRDTVRRRTERATGVVLVGFGARLLLEP